MADTIIPPKDPNGDDRVLNFNPDGSVVVTVSPLPSKTIPGILYGARDPVDEDGVLGSFFLNTQTERMWGPKYENGWGGDFRQFLTMPPEHTFTLPLPGPVTSRVIPFRFYPQNDGQSSFVGFTLGTAPTAPVSLLVHLNGNPYVTLANNVKAQPGERSSEFLFITNRFSYDHYFDFEVVGDTGADMLIHFGYYKDAW